MDRTRAIRLGPRVLWSITLTLFAVAYNVSAVPAIMPAIVRDLDGSMGGIQSILVLFSLVTAAFAPTAENLCRYFGRTAVFLTSVVIYALGIVAAALSPTMSALAVSFAVVAGLGAASLVSTPWTIADLAYGGKIDPRVNVALSVATTFGAVAGALTAGFLASGIGWRWSFVPSLAVLVVVLAFSRDLPRFRGASDQPIDWFGGLLSFLGFGSILVGLSLGSEFGWWAPRREFWVAGHVLPPFSISIVPALLAAGAIELGLFAFWQRRFTQRRRRVSLVSVGLLRRPVFVIGTLAAMMQTLVITGVQFNLYQFLPLAASLNPFRTALAIVPYPATVTVVTVAARYLHLSERFSPKHIVYAGLALLAIGIAMMRGRLDVGLSALDLLPGLVVMGAGSGLSLSAIGDLTYGAASPQERGEGSAIYNPVQNLGNSLGRAILGTLFVFASARGIVDGVLNELGTSLSRGERAGLIFQLQEMIQTMPREELVENVLGRLPESLRPVVHGIELEASTYGIRTSFLLALGLVAVCYLLARRLPAYPAEAAAEATDSRDA